jgi:hypothetical protein
MGFLKKITRPISRALDKIIPNEVKPALPFLAAAAPFMAPGLMGLGGNTMLSRALMSGGLNLGAQLAQEGSEGDFSGLSTLMAAATGALSTPGSAGGRTLPDGSGGSYSQVMGGDKLASTGTQSAGDFFKNKALGMDPGFAKSGLGALETSSNYLSGVSDTLQNNLFSMEGLKAASIPFTQGTTDLVVAENRRAQKDYDREMADYEAGIDSENSNRAFAIRQSMEAYGFTEQEILDAIEAAGYRAGGRVGLSNGGTTPVYLKDSILKDKDYLKTLSSADKLENFMTEFLEEKKLPSKRKYNKVMDTFDSIESEEGTLSKLENKYADKYDYDTLDPFDRGPMEVLIMEKMLEDREKSVGELDLKTYEMIKELGLEDKFIELEKERDRKKNKKSIGGRVGFEFGGIPAAVEGVEEKPKEFLVDKLKVTVQPGQSEEMGILNAMFNDTDGVMSDERKMEFYKLYIPQLYRRGEISEEVYEGMKEDIFGEGKAEGGIMDLGGREMDMRTGGFIPIGKKERADDVPARLSKNEFVMTADAVRAAGGGSVNEGARRMYNLMNNLEARV